MNRRTLTLAGVAGAALAAGLGWQLWHRPSAPATPGPAATGLPLESAASAAPSAAASDSLDFWAQSFERPEGGQITLASLRGKPLIVNFWATWCPPCVREMPLLDAYAKRHAAKGLTVVGLAVDGPSPVREYLQKTPVSFPIGLTGFAGTELARQLGNAQGGLPYTVVFDAGGAPIRQKLGETKEADLAEWTRALGL